MVSIMDIDHVVELLCEAIDAGLTVRVDGNDIKVRGPKRAAWLVELIRAHKLEVLLLLTVRWEMPRYLSPCFMCGTSLFWRRIEDNAALCWECCTPEDLSQVVCLVEPQEVNQ